MKDTANYQQTEYFPCNIVSIESWRDPDSGWYWNNSFPIGEYKIPDHVFFSNRKLLHFLREDVDELSQASKGKLRVDRSADSIVEIQVKSTYEPILAIHLLTA